MQNAGLFERPSAAIDQPDVVRPEFLVTRFPARAPVDGLLPMRTVRDSSSRGSLAGDRRRCPRQSMKPNRSGRYPLSAESHRTI